ncbi:kinase-like domain-containing protein [Russula brevipes]|nr:kinase-like domain-containing protein [Russula brevipes]
MTALSRSSDFLTASSTTFIGAVRDEWQLYSDRAEDYTLGPPIGFGSSSIVYHATYLPKDSQDPPVPCALKVLDLDRLPRGSLRLLRRETQLMSLSKHPNVLRVRGSWMDGHKLHIALRLMNAGSAADVMQYSWPGGMEEEVVRCILRQALEGLNYLHINGFIHRDVKAANLLIDDDGTVLLGDLGVSAPLNDDDHTHAHVNDAASRAVIFDPEPDVMPPRRSKVGKRRSFVGTPCWMAPELISGIQYDSSADIWSFGITALELAQGRAPRSRESSRTVLSHIVQAAPPTLDREGGVHKYSRAFKEVVERCLVKDPSLRPTAAQLLQMPFFRNAKKSSTSLAPYFRLERRKQPSLLLHGTIDSWDFPTYLFMPSPTQSVFRRSRRTSLDGRTSMDELDEQEDARGDQVGGSIRPEDDDRSCRSSPTSPEEAALARVFAQSAKSPQPSRAQSPSKPLLNPLSPVSSTFVPVSVPPPNEPVAPPPNPSLWRRIRRSTGHSKEATQGAKRLH